MNSTLTYDLLERLASLLRAEERRLGKEHGLEPVHLRALRFLARANRYSDTPVAVSEYLGLTKGTASQTLIRLQEKGMLAASPDPKDGRRVHLRLTRAGRKVVSHVDPPKLFQEALEASSVSSSLQGSFLDLLRTLQHLNGSRPFGVCRSCVHFRSGDGKGSFLCGLTEEPLKARESHLICREHQPVSATQGN